MKNLAFAPVITDGQFGIGLAERDKPGYWPKPLYGTFATWEQACSEANKLNSQAGLSLADAALIVCSSMAAHNKSKPSSNRK